MEMTLDPIVRLSRDLKAAAVTLSPNEARYLVDAYYSIQEYRKASANQVKALEKADEPHEVIDWLFKQTETLEKQIVRALDAWSDTVPVAVWAKSQCGVGAVLASGLAAHIDIKKARTAGQIWSFAGLNPGVKWEKKQKRPWNAALKCIAWKLGQSFVKVCNNPNDVYGKLYIERKAKEWEMNLSGKLAEQAGAKEEVVGKDTQSRLWYSGKFDPDVVRQFMAEEKDMMTLPVAEMGKGVKMLPPAHIHARACRWTVKIFLSHYHHVAHVLEYGTEPPRPYVIEHLGHVDMINPPNWPMK